MKKEDSIEKFIKKRIDSYFDDHDASPIINCLAEDVRWMGIEKEETFSNRSSLILLLQDERLLFSKYHIFEDNYHSVALKDDLFQVFGDLHLRHANANIYDLNFRLSILMKCVKDTYVIKTIHFSYGNPISGLHSDEFHSLQDVPNLQLKYMINKTTEELKESNEDLERFTKNLPGGVFRCRYDDALTILKMSNGFLTMFGYSEEELKTKLHNSFRSLIDPRDRENIDQEVQKQLQHSRYKELEYRVVCKNGTSIWVLDRGQQIYEKDGTISFYCILIDITGQKEAQEKLKMTLERHEIIMNQTNDIIFEWDIVKDSFTFSINWEKKFGYAPLNLTSGEVPKKSHLHPQDASAFYTMLLRLKEGTPYLENEVRIQNKDGKYLWCQVRMTTQYNQNHIPISAVGVLIDIDRMKKESAKLMQKAQQDPLTKLYNKEAVEKLIEHTLVPGQQHALMIIDIDDFKYINDTMGHLFGDAYLREVSKQIVNHFRNNDIVGRIGGDEFIVFIKDIEKMEDIIGKAKEIIDVFHNIQIKEIHAQHISCSVGIALFPDHGRNFQQLYTNADLSLYEAKSKGKNQFVLCNNEILNDAQFNKANASHSAVNETIDVYHNPSDDFSLDALMEYVFKILYQSMDIKVAISSIIQIIGQKFDVSRVYIFEMSEDKKHYDITFEWCNSNIEAIINKIAKIPSENVKNHLQFDYFNNSDIFYCQDVHELPPSEYNLLAAQGVKSTLQCAIRDGHRIQGFVGFDECREHRFWTQAQINSLSFIAALISTFLLKDRAQRHLTETANDLRTILDNQNSWIYVVDNQTYKIRYINKKTHDLIPSIKLGVSCYENLFHRTSPCELCPIKAYDKSNPNKGIEIYNPFLDVWCIANAGQTTWENEDCFLISCHDITEFKK